MSFIDQTKTMGAIRSPVVVQSGIKRQDGLVLAG